jgi:hypothetical protein
LKTRAHQLLVVVLVLSTLITLNPTSNAAQAALQIQVVHSLDKAGAVNIAFKSGIKTKATSYTVTATPSNKTGVVIKQVVKKRLLSYNQISLNGLTPGVSYEFKISAIGSKGQSHNSRSYTYQPAATTASAVVITKATATDSDEAVVFFDAPSFDGGSSILYYTATSTPGKITATSMQQGSGSITIYGLEKSTNYTFTITAHNLEGQSVISNTSLAIKTLDQKIVRITPASVPVLAAPVFSLSSAAETRTVNTAATGFTTTSTGGAIASFAINATPAGMSFNTTTGALTGTPNTVAAATNYTITATNASGSATQTFRLTVSAVVYTVGQTGPGGGTVFYVATTSFACGPTRAATCTYLEVAPNTWNGGTQDPTKLWAINANKHTDVTEIPNEAAANNDIAGLGVGLQNSIAIVNQGNDTTTAAGAARAYRGGTQSDWFLPATVELNLLCQWARNVTQAVSTPCTGGTLNTGTGANGGFEAGIYWSSVEHNPSDVRFQNFSNGEQSNQLGKDTSIRVRPIRAF